MKTLILGFVVALAFASAAYAQQNTSIHIFDAHGQYQGQIVAQPDGSNQFFNARNQYIGQTQAPQPPPSQLFQAQAQRFTNPLPTAVTPFTVGGSK